ncbi:MAG: CBS domain-containing protein [Piscirickettsiaceae bacterium]|nr:CBS domain-containing protein [Piscirickettsiaceae bacterium]
MKVRSVTKNKGKPVITLSPADTLDQAVSLMMVHRIGSVLIVDPDTLVGILSERDLLRVLHQGLDQSLVNITVKQAMTPNPITCDPDESLEDAMTKMVDNNIRHLPVVYKGKLEGMLSITDIVEELLKKAKFENRLLKNYIQNWPEEGEAEQNG